MQGIVNQTECVSPLSLYGHCPGDEVPRIPDEYLEGTIYLYFDSQRAKVGERQGGSGFLIGIDADTVPKTRHIYAVTNRHVIEEGATVLRINRHDGTAEPLDLTERVWRFHPDGTDIAIAKIKIDPNVHKYRTLRFDALVSKEMYAKQGLGIGDDVFLVGRYVGSDGKEVNIPTVRFGNIAQNEATILKDKHGRDQESFIVEGRSIGGFSGSPVYVHIQPMTLRPGQDGLSGRYWGPGLLGVDWCHPAYFEPLRDNNGPVASGHFVQANSGFMGVIPAWKLHELLTLPDVTAERKMMEEAYKKSKTDNAANSSDVALSENSDRDNSDEVLKKMLSTPPKPHNAGD